MGVGGLAANHVGNGIWGLGGPLSREAEGGCMIEGLPPYAESVPVPFAGTGPSSHDSMEFTLREIVSCHFT